MREQWFVKKYMVLPNSFPSALFQYDVLTAKKDVDSVPKVFVLGMLIHNVTFIKRTEFSKYMYQLYIILSTVQL